METERLRANQNQAERTLESRERTHRQRVKGLEEQVSTLKDQLGQEMKKRQQYIRSVNRLNADLKLCFIYGVNIVTRSRKKEQTWSCLISDNEKTTLV